MRGVEWFKSLGPWNPGTVGPLNLFFLNYSGSHFESHSECHSEVKEWLWYGSRGGWEGLMLVDGWSGDSITSLLVLFLVF